MAPGDVAWDTELRGFGVRHRMRDRIYLVKAQIKGRQRILTIGRDQEAGRGTTKGPARSEATARDHRKRGRPRRRARPGKEGAGSGCLRGALSCRVCPPAQKVRTVTEDERLLRLHILPVLGNGEVRDIGSSDVARFHHGLRATPVAANRALALLSGILGWAEKVGERTDGSNPCRHIERYPEKPRERLLTAAELARLGDALDRAAQSWTDASKAAWRDECERQADTADLLPTARAAWIKARMPERDTPEDWRAIAAFRLLIFTGARLSEILTLRWAWIDLTQGVARLPDSKTGAKNLYLPPGALAVLAALPHMVGNPYILAAIDRAGISSASRSLGNGFARSLGCPICASTTCAMRSHPLRWRAATVCSSSGSFLDTGSPARPSDMPISRLILPRLLRIARQDGSRTS